MAAKESFDIDCLEWVEKLGIHLISAEEYLLGKVKGEAEVMA